MNTIFIQIASYRDAELIPTIKDCISKAKEKERLSFGICWQKGPEEPEEIDDGDPIFEGVDIRVHKVSYTESQGMGWARKICQSLWKGEKWQLQVDSHMRFSENWDYEAMKMLSRCDSKKPILTCRCPPYDIKTGKLKGDGTTTYMRANRFRSNGSLALSSGYYNKKKLPDKPEAGGFMSGHFILSSSDLIKEMPYEDKIAIITTGDEPLLGIKAWTKGWDMFYPDRPLAWHHFGRGDDTKYHNDHKGWSKLHDIGVNRVQDILDSKVEGDLGLGDVRTLNEYEKYTGVDFVKKELKKDFPILGPYKSKSKAEINPAIKKNKESAGDKIFVQIASYRDPDVEGTIKDLLAKSDHPENLIVAVCDQYGPENKHLDYYDNENFRVIRVPFYMSDGLGWARHQLQKLYFDGDAKYNMQLDSHMRFAPSWDTELIDMMNKTGSPKPIISHYCQGVSSKDVKEDGYLRKSSPLKMYCKNFKEAGTIALRARGLDKEDDRSKPGKSMWVSGHFYFTLTEHIKEFPYDPDLYFFGDEITLAVRSWTKGWDIFWPNKPIVYHNYTREERALHWSDHKRQKKLNEKSLNRVRQMLGQEDNNEDLGIYGLGDVRSLEEYQEITGINFKERTLSERATKGRPVFA